MKTKLLITFLFLNTTFLSAQLTPKWEELNSGLNYIQDSTSDKDNYIFNRNTIWNYTYYFNSSYAINQLDSNNYARTVHETIQSFPKDGKYYYKMKDVRNYHHIEITNDRLKTWKRIFTFKDNTDEYFDNIHTDSLGGIHLIYLNDSTILISGIFKEHGFYDSPYIGKLTSGNNPDSLWNFELIRHWRRTTFESIDIKMINEKIGYAEYRNIFVNRDEIFRTDDCWNTYKIVYPLDSDKNPVTDFSNLYVRADKNDTLILFYDYYLEDMLYYTLDNFKTKYIVDFTFEEPVYRIYAYSPKIIYVLTAITKTDSNYKNYTLSKLLKTTNYGNSWKILYEGKRSDTIYSFRVYDEDHITLTGKFHPVEPFIRSSFIQTTDGGNNWHFLFEPNYSDYEYNSFEGDLIPTFLYVNKEQIICCKYTAYYKQPYYDTDLSYFNQIREYRDKHINYYVGYYQSLIESTLFPPLIKMDDSLITKHNFDLDTLYWKKVYGATAYKISYYGVASSSFKQNRYYGQDNFSTLTTQRTDTVVSDTFLIIKNLKRNYIYKFFATSINEKQKSEETLLITTCKEEPKLEEPIILYPIEDNEYPFVRDTVPPGEITFRWRKVPNAESYNLTLYDAEPIAKSIYSQTMRYLVNIQNYADTSYTFKNLEPNSTYLLTITAQNNEEITKFALSQFYTKDNVSVPNDEYFDNEIIYPNPATDYINVDMSFLRMQESEIKVYNIFGESVLSTPSSLRDANPQEGDKYRIDVSSLPPGVYFVRIGNQKPIKFVKL